MSERSTKLAVAIELTLLGNPQGKEWFKNAANRIPVDLKDQLDAAVRDTTEITGLTATLGDYDILNTGQTPRWVVQALSQHVAKFVLNEIDTCIHNPAPLRPQPVILAAWRPDLAVCMRCLHLVTLPLRGREARLCDGCGKECRGVDVGDPIREGQVQIGMIRYIYGACRDCFPINSKATT